MSSTIPRAFTLIELLVVISIVALLVAILLPSLKAARSQARVAVCMASLRQCNTAMINYAAEHNGWGAPHPGTTFSSSTGLTYPNWHNGGHWLNYGIAGPAVTAGGYSGVDPYLGYTPDTPDDAKIHYRTNGCPSFPDELPAAYDVAYSANQRLLDPWGLAPYTRWHNLMTDIYHPDKTMLMVENWRSNIGPGIKPSILADTLRVKGVLNLPRHEGRGINHAFVDGHVQFFDYEIPDPSNHLTDIITPRLPLYSNTP